MTTILHGIPNCDTVKKARSWLDARGTAYTFHDFKKTGVERALLASWLKQVPWETLVNRKGTTWRGLAEERKLAINDASSAIDLMLESPSVIKRPVLVHGDSVHVGFSAESYQQIFSKNP